MKIKIIMKYIFTFFFLLCAIILFCTKNVSSCLTGVTFVYLVILISPIFDYLCLLTNKYFSVGRKITIGIITFLIPFTIFSSNEIAMEHIITEIFVINIFWVLMFGLNKKPYIDTNKKELKNEVSSNDIFSKIYNKCVRKHNNKMKVFLDYERKIKNKLTNMSFASTYAVSELLNENRKISNDLFNHDMPKVDICEMVLDFCKDSYNITNEYSLNSLYTPSYYINKLNKHCSTLQIYTRNKIRTQTRDNSYITIYNKYINIFMGIMNECSSIKFYKVAAIINEDLNKYKNYGTESIDENYRDCFLYMIDLLATCTCISKLLFVEKYVNKLDESNEFYKIVSNMSREIKNTDTIIKKTRPIYDEFYKSTLGLINDELLYGIAVAIIVNNNNDKPLTKKEQTILQLSNNKINDISSYNKLMQEWIFNISKEYRNLEIERYIIYKTINSVKKENFELYISTLSNLGPLAKLYYNSVEHNNKINDKDRYLKGDFEKEKQELLGKYSLNNIATGTQFELYLVELFKDLGYKVKHNGKSGDQGADLILKKDDYVYAVQAKYYTGKLGNTPIQEIVGALKYYNANQGVVITNSKFTDGAKKLAKANNVILIDGKDLKKLVDYTFDEEHDTDVLKLFEK